MTDYQHVQLQQCAECICDADGPLHEARAKVPVTPCVEVSVDTYEGSVSAWWCEECLMAKVNMLRGAK